MGSWTEIKKGAGVQVAPGDEVVLHFAIAESAEVSRLTGVLQACSREFPTLLEGVRAGS